ncbi:MAG TPA: tRNA lysidine(34) synthetase TilS [Flavisolibacter sp.]|jgi:tRNA(Ile)-lysidine synthase|nr:tRNA lysidine(34) synthetase TilS [Flavisolibacter sp.]
MNCLQRFQDSLYKYNLSDHHQVLLAVSGGVDSVVLCALSKEAGLSFAIAHCNFGLRGAESERDEAFVKSLGETYGVEVFVKKFDTAAIAQEQCISIQEAARALRYDWFEVVRKEHGFACTLLAHHANDNLETVLMNFFRGTGLEGLTGMPEENREKHCLRPMLHLKRKEILAYAAERNLQWMEDSSNASNKYTRNFFRNSLFPQLQTVFPQVEDNLLNNIRRMQETAALYNELVAGLKKKVCEVRGEELHIPVLKLMKYKNTSLIYEIIKDYGFGEQYVAEVIKLADATSGKYIANAQWRIIRHRAWFIIAPKTTLAQTLVVEKEDESTRFDHFELLLTFLKKEKFSLDKSSNIAQLDAGEVAFPLVLRRWKKGDYFYPLGMRKKKKLARFFIDQKLSQTQKEKVWVVESHKRIVWIVGHRIDDRFKVTENTRQVLQLSLSSL